MTILGKMMAIFVLILSILQGALTVMVFVSRSNWVAQNKLLGNQRDVANTSAAQFQKDADDARAASQASETRMQGIVAKGEEENKRLAAFISGVEKQLSDAKIDAAQQKIIATAAQNDARLRQDDNKRMLEVIKDRDAVIAQNVNEIKKAREDRVTAEIDRNVMVNRLQQMEAKLRDAVRDLAKHSTAVTTTVAKTDAPNPPTESVEGLVSATDNSGLVTLTIGSDAGLKEGNTLEAYRIAAIPSQSQYLGMIRIRSVKPDKAVAEPVGRMSAPLQRGDHVSSRVLGGG
jgi:hypothetical protein